MLHCSHTRFVVSNVSYVANCAVQYSLLVFEIVFYNPYNTMGVMYKGWVSDGVGGQAEGRFSLPLGHRQWCCVLSS